MYYAENEYTKTKWVTQTLKQDAAGLEVLKNIERIAVDPPPGEGGTLLSRGRVSSYTYFPRRTAALARRVDFYY